MHLVLGRTDDPCCAGVLQRLHEYGLAARVVTNPFAAPARLAWHLHDGGIESRLALDGVADEAIASVLVRDGGWIDPAGWEPADHAYMQAETRAAQLAWLASLSCPVINRPSAAFWYRPRMPLLAWQALVRRAGLPTPDTLVTNDCTTGRDFAHELDAQSGTSRALYTPLTGDAAWVVKDSDWPGLAALQKLAPVCLTEAHGPAHPACIVGRQIVWDGNPGSEVTALAPGLLRLAQLAGLDCLEVAIAPVRGRQVVVLIEAVMRLEHFAAPTRERIVDALVRLLIGKVVGVHPAEEIAT